ncbi:TonB-dependent receptor [Negadavirga shengliensis]|uniref:TonB-dependent receptor n=1 Tax=Negadavirga shengliensis TaxID=1389218 RepID=A0ABV9T3E7_9BACT
MRKTFPILPFLLLLGSPVLSQQTLRGIIRDAYGEPLVGATVILPVTHDFAIADENGLFVLTTSASLPVMIKASFVGFDAYEARIEEWPSSLLEIILKEGDLLSEVVVIARRRQEEIRSVPIPITVVGGSQIDDAGAFNVGRVKELVPTVQLYSSNPRNTALNIRGLGTTFGLTNDGIDPGVGFYMDGVYYARPAVTALDFVDVEQIEILRGPQGTLFGKNTTAGAFNITTKRPRFQPDATLESSIGNYGFIQTKGTLTGPLNHKLAGRLSFSGTRRNGVLYHTVTHNHVNTLNNFGLRTQLLYLLSEKTEIMLAADVNLQRPDGYAQVMVGAVETRLAEFRQFDQITKDLGYTLPSSNPFDRLIDHDTPWRSGNDMGGISLNTDAELGKGKLTSTTAWRYWNWAPSNDRDFTGLQALALSEAPSKHHQWSQEIRYAWDFNAKLSGVAGIFALGQDLRSDPFHIEESGMHQWRFAQTSPNPLWQTPGLLDGYGIKTRSSLKSLSGAVFGQLDWKITDDLSLLPGIRWNYDEKQVDFDRKTYGGLETDDPELIAIKNAVYNDQAFAAAVSESNFSGQLTLAYQANDWVNTFVTHSLGFKPVGINLGGLPRENGRTMLELARIEPEHVSHWELGIKSSPTGQTALNVVFFNTQIKNFQTLVQSPDLSVNRGYLANAERVRVRGVEMDFSAKVHKNMSIFGALAYTDGEYVSFTNAPVPLEDVGGEHFKDISGGRLPGISTWAGSGGGELTKEGKFLLWKGIYFFASEAFFRTEFSSSPSPSRYLNIDGYILANARMGFRSTDGLSAFIWSRNLVNADYFEQLLPGAGNTGHYAAVLGDPRTFGVTMRYTF